MISLFGRTFAHGVHPHDHKEATADRPIERMPFVERYLIPLEQHIGAGAKPVVEPGAEVQRGQRIAEPGGFVSTSLHSPVQGTVASIGPQRNPEGLIGDAIEIRADPYATQKMEPKPVPWEDATNEEFVRHVQDAGLVGLGGAAFPSHVKYALKPEQPVRELVLNGSECEPYLTTDHRVMVERPGEVVRGIEILGRKLGVERAAIGVELNKKDAIAALEKAVAAGEKPFPIRVVPLTVKYPQGAEKMLIKALYGKEVPSAEAALGPGHRRQQRQHHGQPWPDWFDHGEPLVDRVVTVSGPAVDRAEPTCIVPLGTPIRDGAGPLRRGQPGHVHAWYVVMGGPMMGHARRGHPGRARDQGHQRACWLFGERMTWRDREAYEPLHPLWTLPGRPAPCVAQPVHADGRLAQGRALIDEMAGLSRPHGLHGVRRLHLGLPLRTSPSCTFCARRRCRCASCQNPEGDEGEVDE